MDITVCISSKTSIYPVPGNFPFAVYCIQTVICQFPHASQFPGRQVVVQHLLNIRNRPKMVKAVTFIWNYQRYYPVFFEHSGTIFKKPMKSVVCSIK